MIYGGCEDGWDNRLIRADFRRGLPMENLRHNSKAVHRGYAKRAQTKIPSLEEFEAQAEGQS